MSTLGVAASPPSGYFRRLAAIVRQGVAQVIRPASHSHRAEAARGWARGMLVLSIGAAALIIALMFWLDATEITWMPPRGTASLWPVRIATDFGKSAYVISALVIVLAAVVLLVPRLVGVAHATLIGFAARLQYLLLSVVFAVVAGEILKGIIGRGRPFVGGEPNAFHFSHFSWSEAYASFPSGHATTSCALGFAVAALWPRLRVAMALYVFAILASRLVLLAHHPSDVVAGALVGVTGAMIVRYWFAARRVVFVIRADGSIAPRAGPSASGVLLAMRKAVTS